MRICSWIVGSNLKRYEPNSPQSNEDYDPIFSIAEVSIDSIVALARYCTLSFSERNILFPGEQYCFTCTCKAA